jgi:integrase/recombinase XerD
MSKLIFLTGTELELLKNNTSNDRDLMIISLLYETGCTVNELINIKIKNILFEKNELIFPKEDTKTKKERKSYISKKLIKELRKFVVGKNDFLFASRESHKITTKRIRQIIQAISKKANLSLINPQVLRYTHVAHALEKDIPLKAIQSQIGIEELRMVQIYQQIKQKGDIKSYYEKW